MISLSIQSNVRRRQDFCLVRGADNAAVIRWLIRVRAAKMGESIEPTS
jgi:hypothetical protein